MHCSCIKNSIKVVTRLEYSVVVCHVVLLYSVDWTRLGISFIFLTENQLLTKLLSSVVYTQFSKYPQGHLAQVVRNATISPYYSFFRTVSGSIPMQVIQ